MKGWQNEALCRDMDTELFFDCIDGERKRSVKLQVLADVRALCARCPVRVACLDAAMEEEEKGERYGVRAGLTPAERKRLEARGGRRGIDPADVRSRLR